MKNTYKAYKNEIRYQIYSKSIFTIFALVIILSILNLISLKNTVEYNYDRYLKTKVSYIERGLNIEDELRLSNEIDNDGDLTIIKNPLKYDYMNLANSIHNIKPENIASSTLEYITFVFCTFLVAIYSAYIATYDYKYNTLKLKTNRKKMLITILSKLISVFVSIFIILISTLIITYIISFFIQMAIQKEIPIDDYSFEIFKFKNNLIIQVLFSYLILCVYSILGFFTGFLFKNMFVPTTIFALYGFVIPIKGKYDIRNMISSLSYSIFDFQGRFKMFTPLEVNNNCSVLLLIGISILAIILTILIGKKRSIYD